MIISRRGGMGDKDEGDGTGTGNSHDMRRETCQNITLVSGYNSNTERGEGGFCQDDFKGLLAPLP